MPSAESLISAVVLESLHKAIHRVAVYPTVNALVSLQSTPLPGMRYVSGILPIIANLHRLRLYAYIPIIWLRILP